MLKATDTCTFCNIPAGNAPFQQADGECPAKAAADDKDPAAHLRRVFYRMGMGK